MRRNRPREGNCGHGDRRGRRTIDTSRPKPKIVLGYAFLYGRARWCNAPRDGSCFGAGRGVICSSHAEYDGVLWGDRLRVTAR